MERNYSTNITELYFSTYKFQLFYFEKLNQNIPEFPHDHDMFEIYCTKSLARRPSIGISNHYFFKLK